QKTNSKSSEKAWYQYAGGERIRKYVDKGNIKEERIYLGGFEIYRKFDTSSGTSSLILERQTVHISDDSGRIAMLEKRTIGTDDAAETLTRYVYSNHLQSASLELDGIGDIISYEEYHPYGTTAFQAKNVSINAVAKRYRYTGKERDEESGLYYHGARYYIPWLCRWTAIDPMESKYAGMSPYNYSFNNPIMWNDPSGADPGKGDDEIKKQLEKDKEKLSNPGEEGEHYLDIDKTNWLFSNNEWGIDRGELEGVVVTSTKAGFAGKEMGFALPLIGRWITAAAEAVAPFVARAAPIIARGFPVVATIVTAAWVIAEILKKFRKTKEEETIWSPIPLPKRIATNESQNKTDEVAQSKNAPKSDSTYRPVTIPTEEQKKHIQKAIVRQYDNGLPGVGHFTIEVINDKRSVNTHQVTTPDQEHSRIVEARNMPMPLVHQAIIELPNAAAAMQFQRTIMEFNDLGKYDLIGNSCLSHVADVLSTGGGEKVDKSRTGYARFITKHGFKQFKK
ncbi:MAG: RHS repeat-associated core domain-containing protein, partial [Taibaiella sp.]|nr:RHS repeat-associated core domain-containing protein [Taibaiella sp.]